MALESQTPLMKQYFTIKSHYPDCLLFFQVGDFYELFFEDAQKASAFLNITLTKRGKINGEPIPLCGVPVHAIDHYSAKLIRGGFKIALVDQLTPAKQGTIVERGVTRVLTPGTLTDTNLLDNKSASYLFSIFPLNGQWGLIFSELLTAQLFATVIPEYDEKKLLAELVRFFPDEILVPVSAQGKALQSLFKKTGYFTSIIEDDFFCDVRRNDFIAWAKNQFDESVSAQLLQNNVLSLACSVLHAYLQKNQKQALDQFNAVHFYEPEDFLVIDVSTQRNLELVKNLHDGSSKHTLLSVIDGAYTGMGSRMIKKWLLRPLVKKEAIVHRQECVELYVNDLLFAQQMSDFFKTVGDIERIVGRISLQRAIPADYHALLNLLELLPAMRLVLGKYAHIPLLRFILTSFVDFSSLQKLLKSALNSDSSKEWIIAAGFSQELDRMRSVVQKGNILILDFEAQEQKNTGISSLKVRYNRIQGYYIEITKTHKLSIPSHYTLQQNLVGKDRYITIQLQELQHELLSACNEIEHLEKVLFDQIKLDVYFYSSSLRKLAHALAMLDALAGLGKVAYDNRYVKPVFNHNRHIVITHGRHPVVEQSLQSHFIPNDTALSDEQSVWIITGPNMGGKSTYLRQVALLSVLAQIGSFVPAKEANLFVLDKIFTRIGAGDNLAEGKSTFLVEMEETAAICTQATPNSLVILDEVGRGTSTFDGLAIAQAVVEFLYKNVQARCLFATHYHELTLLAQEYPE